MLKDGPFGRRHHHNGAGSVPALSGIPVRHDVAMTGEITLRGRVLPIGGLERRWRSLPQRHENGHHPAGK